MLAWIVALLKKESVKRGGMMALTGGAWVLRKLTNDKDAMERTEEWAKEKGAKTKSKALGAVFNIIETGARSQAKKAGGHGSQSEIAPGMAGAAGDHASKSERSKKMLLTAVSYIAIVFPLALAWHVGLFREQYERFGYFEGEPNVLLGLATIVIQGVVLGWLYPRFRPASDRYARAFSFAGIMGLFLWTSHVLALVAKQNVPDGVDFILMETAYLIAQFGLFALALGFIHRGRN